jgi:hypothetical protein
MTDATHTPIKWSASNALALPPNVVLSLQAPASYSFTLVLSIPIRTRSLNVIEKEKGSENVNANAKENAPMLSSPL